MGNTDSVPGISQLKSFCQVLGGDVEGAKRTQENFSRQCPVVSQCRSTVEATYDPDAARITQEEFLNKTVLPTVEATPLVGHITGGIYYALGENEKADACMKAASRTAVVGVAGMVAGPAGAVAAGAGMDVTITAVDSAVHNEERLYGSCASINDVVTGKDVIGGAFDVGIGIATDALAGQKAQKTGKNMKKTTHKAFNKVKTAARKKKMQTLVKKTITKKNAKKLAKQVSKPVKAKYKKELKKMAREELQKLISIESEQRKRFLKMLEEEISEISANDTEFATMFEARKDEFLNKVAQHMKLIDCEDPSAGHETNKLETTLKMLKKTKKEIMPLVDQIKDHGWKEGTEFYIQEKIEQAFDRAMVKWNPF